MTHSITRRTAPVSLVLLALLTGCQWMTWNKDEKPKAKPAGPPTAVAHIKPSQIPSTRPALGNPGGTVTFTQQADHVRVVADLTGLPANATLGFHIHEKGDLSDPAMANAGAHYNPDKHLHAGLDQPQRHAGDLGNLTTDERGRARLDVSVSNISVNGTRNPVVGRAVIVHANRDDLRSQPSGNAGDRIGGGVIELQQ
jgi:Cu-Zn family superoxide dismutase